MEKRVKDLDSFIKRAREIHGDKYDYSNVIYTNSHAPVNIICKKHGEFQQMPNSHLRGCGCPVCGKNKPIDSDEFLRRMHNIYGERYDFSNVTYCGLDVPIKLVCPIHGEFEKTPRNLLRGHACPLCGRAAISKSRSETTEKFIEKANLVHGGFYDYSKTNVVNSLEPVIITCPKHGDFLQSTASHLMGHGCPECAKHFGVAEGNVLKALTEIFGNVVPQYKPKWLQSRTSYQSIDIFLPDYNVGVEYQGAQHFGAEARFSGEEGYKILSERDIRKYNKCLEHGVKLFYISFEKNVPENYIDIVYKNTNDLIAAIQTYISKSQPIKLSEADIKRIVLEATKTVITNYL